MQKSVARKVEQFFRKKQPFKWKKRKVIIRADEDPTDIFFLKDGYIRQYILSKNGKETTLTIYKPHSFFPMMGAITALPNVSYFETITAVSGYQTAKEDVLSYLKTQPDVMYDLLKRVFVGMEALLMRKNFLQTSDAENKIGATLLHLSYRFGKKSKNAATITLRLTHKDIADETGLSRETVSRIVKKMEKEGLLSYTDHHIVLHNIKHLEQKFLL